MVASAFGDVQIAGVFEGLDDRGAEGGQVAGSVAGAAGRMVLWGPRRYAEAPRSLLVRAVTAAGRSG